MSNEKPPLNIKGVIFLSKLLFNSQPLVIDRELAKIIGLNESIVLQQIHYWLEINKAKKHNFFDERYWTYNTIKDWHENDFYFWSEKTVSRTFTALESLGLLMVGDYNKERRDRTKWYSIDYEKLEQLEEEYLHKDKMTKCNKTLDKEIAKGQNDQMHKDNLGTALPKTYYTEISFSKDNAPNKETIKKSNPSNPSIVKNKKQKRIDKTDMIEFPDIDTLTVYYADLYKLPLESVLSTYDRVKEQHNANNVTKFTAYFEKALENEKEDYEHKKFIDIKTHYD